MGFFNRGQTAPSGHHHHATTATTDAPAWKKKRTGIFSKRSGLAHGTSSHHHHHHHGHHGHYTMSTRPTFGQWLKHTLLDIITMIIMGAIGLGVYMAHPAPSRSFAVQFSDGEVVYPEFAYPMRKEIIPIWAAALLAALVPIAVFLIVQIRVRSFWDVNNATIGLLYSLISAAVFQVFIKWLIGGLRPHFLAVCKPDITKAKAGGGGYNHKGFTQMYFTPEICTGDRDEIDDSLESFPSGHTTAAFAGFVFLYLYLNAKLKVFANYHPAMWKLIAIYAPILGAVLIGGALTIDEYHNWYDILAGAVIGTVMAFSAYRMTYASIWDWRYNHIPLNRGAPFMFDHGGELSNATFTRKVGWGEVAAGALHEKGHHHHHHGQHHVGGHTNGLDNGYHNGAHHNGYETGPSIPRRAVGAGGRGDEMV